MRYFSCFSGIEAASVAWHPLGWTPVGFSEIDPFASAVLAHRFPGVKNYGDITKHAEWDGVVRGSVDVLVGGSPCQAFSVAGLRKGLDDPRGQLTLVYLQLAARLEPEWIVWENVPGVLSADGGRAFGAFLGGLAELGYGFAWRVLDARYFGVPQRRRRVFLVARRAGDWTSPAEVLLEPTRMPGDFASGGAPRQIPAGSSEGGARERRTWPADIACTLNAMYGRKMGLEDQHAFNGASLFVPHHVGALTAKGPMANGAPEVDANHFLPVVYGGSSQDVSDTVTSKWAKGSGGPSGSETGLFVAQPFSPHGHYRYEASEHAATLQDRENRQGGHTHLVAHAFYSTGGSHGLEPQPNVCPPLKVGSALGIPSPPAVAFTIDMQGCKGNANVGDGSVSPTLGRPSGNDCHAVVYGIDEEQNAAAELMGCLKARTAGGGFEGSVAYPIDGRNAMRDPEKHDEVNRQGVGIGNAGDPAHTVTSACVHAVAVDVYNQTVDGDCAATVTAAAGGTNTSGPKVVAFRKSRRAQSSTDNETWVDDGIANTLNGFDTGDVRTTHAVAFTCSEQSNSFAWERPIFPTITAQRPSDTSNLQTGIRVGMVVRRLTPVECERLQGFPDGWTDIPYRGKAAPDGPRYKALGNSMAVPCMAWIGARIQSVQGGLL